jgi:hypothetical protein
MGALQFALEDDAAALKGAVRRLDTVAERESAYRLRYEAYLREGLIEACVCQRLSDEFDAGPNSLVFGLHAEGRLASSIRLSIATPRLPQCPALAAFPESVRPLLAAGRTIVDPTRFVMDRAAARRHPMLALATMRLAWLAAEFFDAQVLLATPEAGYQGFFARCFGHRTVCLPRPYLGLKRPLSLMLLDCRAERDRVVARFPFFASKTAEREALFGRLSLPGVRGESWSGRPNGRPGSWSFGTHASRRKPLEAAGRGGVPRRERRRPRQHLPG